MPACSSFCHCSNCHRIAVVAGGLQFALPSLQQRPPAAAVPALHRDALALLLGLAPLSPEVLKICRSSLALSKLSAAAEPQLKSVATQQSDSSDGRPAQMTTSSAAAGAAGAPVATGGAGTEPRLLLLDVRRHDERTFYGAIPGSHHLPGVGVCGRRGRGGTRPPQHSNTVSNDTPGHAFDSVLK
jgi:hypothetical protein